MTTELETEVAGHYATSELEARILEGLTALGADLEALTPEDLAPVDEFHTAGRVTTLKALEMMALRPGQHILDIGCGIGGTARCIAAEFGGRATGIDLTPDFVGVATSLTGRSGLSDKCDFKIASALDLPFEAEAFDGAVTFHVAMNIPDRARLYSEAARVLKTGASLCLFDVMKGEGPGMYYPVPWAETENTSFLKTTDESCEFLETNGFIIDKVESLKEFAVAFFKDVFAKAAKADGPPPLGLHLLTGANAPEKFSNYARALDEDMIDPTIIVATKAG
jgi:MPBQ/MSBQ methyltransferase